MKKFVNILLLLIFSAGVIFLLAPEQWFPSFYDVRYMGWAALAGATLVFLSPRLLRVPEKAVNAEQKNHAAEMFQVLLLYVVVSNALGDLGLYELYRFGFQFDKVLHFLTPLVSVYFLSRIVQERFSLSSLRARLWALVLIFLSSFSWELYEYLADIFLQTHLYGVYGSDIYHDTTLDLFFGVSGAVGGFLLAGFYSPRKINI